MTDSLSDHLREHGVRSGPPAPVMPALGRVRARLSVLSRRLQRHPSIGPARQIVCEVCGCLANRGARARYCSDTCKAVARAMRDDALTAPHEAP